MPAAIPIAIAAGAGALSGGVGAAVAGTSVLTGVLVGGGLGAAMGGLGLLLQPDAPKGPSNSQGPLTTHSVRNIPVPVIFGTAKVGGNYIALGDFWTHKDGHDGTPGVRNREMHAYIGLCEGPVQTITDFRIDGKTIKEQVEEMELDAANHFSIQGFKGTKGQGLPPYLANAKERKKYGFAMADPIPWRNTAFLQCGVDVGTTARLAEITCKVKGPDLSIRRKGKTKDSNQHDLVSGCHYDGHSESFYATLSSSDRATPYGLLKVTREKGRVAQTQPPSSVTKHIVRGWYLGKHDILLMQNPDDPATFHLGTWGIARSSDQWEKVTPDPGYARPILFDLLDELNGCLHTVHQGTTNLYVMRWNLLTGWITRLDLDVANTILTGFTFAPDSDAYIIGTKDDRLIFLDANTGKTYHTSQKVATHAIKGLCVAGSLVGLLFTSGCIYYNPFTKTSLRRYGSSSLGTEDGTFGGIGRAVQNTWTGHVTLTKPIAGSTAYINFIPSIPTPNVVTVTKQIPRTEKETVYIFGRMTTKTRTVYDTKKVREDRTDYTGGWTRDWSYRLWDRYSLHALEGEGSVAAALWNAMVDEPATGAGRWGAGLASRYFSLSSFESVHAYSVGPAIYPFKKSSRYMERYQFHFNLDAERTAADFVANEVLLAINGYRTLIDGRLHVGVQRTALAAAAHFTGDLIEQDTGKVAFLGRAAGANRVRVEFPDQNDDYSRTFGEANDEYDQNARGRVVALTLSASGITRLGHARTLAQQIIDAIASNRRQVSFKTHWLGFMLSPGDGIEVTDAKLGLSRYLGRITKIAENENNQIEITAIEHQPVRDLLAAATVNDEDADADCAALAVSAEYRHHQCMTPMHAAVYEDPEDPILVPMAALSPNTRLASQIRIDYKFEDSSKWTSLGKVDSSHGGFLAQNLSATAKAVVIDGQHGTPERIEGDLPVVFGSHEALGVQAPRVAGDEAALATRYIARNQSFGLRRTAGQAWNARNVTVQYAYRVHAIAEEEGCFTPKLYLQGLDACDETPQNAYIPFDQVPAFPFYFHVPSLSRSFLVKTSADATDEPGTVHHDWKAIQADTAGCPYVCGVQVTVENGISTINADVRLRALGRFRDRDWSGGIDILGDQTLACEVWDATDSYFYNRATLFYPMINGKIVKFDDGTSFLDSRYGKPSWGEMRRMLTVKHGDRVSFRWEVWTVSGGAFTTRVFGPHVLNLASGTHTQGLPANAYYTVAPASYEYSLNFTVSGTVWDGPKNVLSDDFATAGPLSSALWDTRYGDYYYGTYGQAFSGGVGGSSEVVKADGVLKIDTGKHIWLHYCGPDLSLGNNYAIEAKLLNHAGGDNNGQDNVSFFLNTKDTFPAGQPVSERSYDITTGVRVQLLRGAPQDAQGQFLPLQHFVQIVSYSDANSSTVLAQYNHGSLLSYPITFRVECASGKDYTVKLNGTTRLTYSAPADTGYRGLAIGRFDSTALGGYASAAWLDDLVVWTSSTPDSRNGTWWLYGTNVSGNRWSYQPTSNQGWNLSMKGNGSYKNPLYWTVTHSDLTGCEYKLVGSEGACSPLGVWTLEPVTTSGCGNANISQAVLTIAPGA